MFYVYLSALILGGGSFLLQVLLSTTDAEHHGADGADTSLDAGLVLFVRPVFQVRFWLFYLLAFGLSGTLFRGIGLLSEPLALALAGFCGVGAGVSAAWVLGRLQRENVDSNVNLNEVVGCCGRVLFPPDTETRGKVRLELGGQSFDLTATSASPLQAGDWVLVEAIEEGTVRVSLAPAELSPAEPTKVG